MDMTYEEIRALAEKLYYFFRKNQEDPDLHRLAASMGTFEDANGYTQDLFINAVRLILDDKK